ncbi:MAG: hypothetical protein M3Q45_08870 [Chloroflexota bacterium]|nr:hypothetical protein [Chloroflexota bacterium]
MDAAQLLAALRRHWAYEATDKEISHEIYHDDAVLEFPQSQERFEGKANFIAWRKRYPAVLEFKIRRIRGGGNFWVAETLSATTAGRGIIRAASSNSAGTRWRGNNLHHAGWEAPDWRAPWRATWQDEALG